MRIHSFSPSILWLLTFPTTSNIVTEPMDLGTVKDNLDDGHYRSPEEVAEHVRLTFRNARTYNKPKHLVHEWARMLEDIWEYKYGELMAKVGTTSCFPYEDTKNEK